MKNIAKWIMIQSVVILILGACSDSFFNEIPSDRITPEQHYKSMQQAEISTKASLAILRDYVPQMVMANELMSDLLVTTENADLNWQDINNHSLSPDNPYLDPSVLYQVVVNSNEALMYIDSIVNVDQDMTELDVKIYKGNLIGIRSWAYFMVARLYDKVAYLENNLPERDPGKINYLSRQAIMDTLISNLLPYLDIDYTDVGNIAMYNKALIGEIYLEKQDYANAVSYLIMAIEGFENEDDMYKVNKDYAKDNWENIFINADGQTKEVMMAVPFALADQQPNPIENWFGYEYDYIAKPSNVIVDLFNTQVDVKGKPGDLYRGLGVSYDTIAGNNFVNKYNLNAVDFSSDIILLRAADTHLLLAEALNRTGNHTAALGLLNAGYHELDKWEDGVGIRGRVNLANRVVPEWADSTAYIEDLIIEERSLELAFEGKRWTDLMRVARRRGAGYLAEKVAKKYSDANIANMVREKLKNEENWYIPVHE